jgi:hypothetical protein
MALAPKRPGLVDIDACRSHRQYRVFPQPLQPPVQQRVHQSLPPPRLVGYGTPCACWHLLSDKEPPLHLPPSPPSLFLLLPSLPLLPSAPRVPPAAPPRRAAESRW